MIRSRKKDFFEESNETLVLAFRSFDFLSHTYGLHTKTQLFVELTDTLISFEYVKT